MRIGNFQDPSDQHYRYHDLIPYAALCRYAPTRLSRAAKSQCWSKNLEH